MSVQVTKQECESLVETSSGIDGFLESVVETMLRSLDQTALGFLFRENKKLLSTGKMLRSRLAYRLWENGSVARETMVHAAAAVEMIHSASLLHDDVIDGGLLRRNLPTFWVEKGVTGAVLLGDMLLFKALDLICQVENGRLTHPLIKMTGELCEGESEQEILLQGIPSQLEACICIARQKTGALFAFIGFASAGDNADCQDALTEAAYRLGTAYQVADDILDAIGTEATAGKTLGTDRERAVMSSAHLLGEGEDRASEVVRDLCEGGVQLAAPWPTLQAGLQTYLETDLGPAIQHLAGIAASPA